MTKNEHDESDETTPSADDLSSARGEELCAGVSPFERLFEAIAQSPLYGPLLAPSIRRRQFERRELLREEEIAKAEHERKLAEIRRSGKRAKPLPKHNAEKKAQKMADMSRYLDGADLTDRQREVLSLKYEYGLTDSQIAERLGVHRTTIQEHLEAGGKRIKYEHVRQIPRKRPGLE